MLQRAIADMLGTNGNIVSLGKEREDTEKNQMEILELKKVNKQNLKFHEGVQRQNGGEISIWVNVVQRGTCLFP